MRSHKTTSRHGKIFKRFSSLWLVFLLKYFFSFVCRQLKRGKKLKGHEYLVLFKWILEWIFFSCHTTCDTFIDFNGNFAVNLFLKIRFLWGYFLCGYKLKKDFFWFKLGTREFGISGLRNCVLKFLSLDLLDFIFHFFYCLVN